MTCENCCNRIPIPGNCHIGCNNPSGNIKKKCWNGCGLFPLSFDENTIIECANKNIPPKNNDNKDAMLELLRVMMR
jgi:hypothetical protein